MPAHSNFQIRTVSDAEASLAAVMAVLRVMLEKQQIDLDRVHQLLTNLTDEDVNLRGRGRWFVDWMAGNHDIDGQRP